MVHLSVEDLSRHMYVLGASGAGKSFALLGWIMTLIQIGKGVTVIDPHGGLVDEILYRLPQLDSRIRDKLVIFDPTNPEDTLCFNPLERSPNQTPERRAEFLATMVTELSGADKQITVRMQRIMFHAFWLLILNNLTLLEYARTLTDRAYRNRLLETIVGAHHPLKNYWYNEFPADDNRGDRTAREWVQSSISRVGRLVNDPDLQLVFGSRESSVNVTVILDRSKIFLVKLSKGVLGKDNSHLLGGFIMAIIQLATLARAENHYGVHTPHFLFIDEFQNYVSNEIEEILAESRKYNLGLVLAHQNFQQLRNQPKLQSAILGNVKNLALFQMSYEDADTFVQDVFNTDDLNQIKEIRTRKEPTGFSFVPYVDKEEIVWQSMEEIRERHARELTNLGDRRFWYKTRGNSEPIRLKTPQIKAIKKTKELQRQVKSLVDRSMAYYGRLKDEVETEIKSRASGTTNTSTKRRRFR